MMKCDELKPITTTDECGSYRVYNKSEVDAAIDELKSAHHKERHEYIKMIAELKQKLENAQASAYAESVDAGMQNRRLKRALYKACANWAFLAQWERGELVENWEKWENVERKCGSKAQEYK